MKKNKELRDRRDRNAGVDEGDGYGRYRHRRELRAKLTQSHHEVEVDVRMLHGANRRFLDALVDKGLL